MDLSRCLEHFLGVLDLKKWVEKYVFGLKKTLQH
jgi:hypothetical protein